MATFNIPLPQQQVDFAEALCLLRNTMLQKALTDTVKRIDLQTLDQELNTYVPADSLKQLAIKGLRGELAFPVPYLLRENPTLLGYYRLLLGYSQKDFYDSKVASKFKQMEVKGKLTPVNEAMLPDLCKSLICCSAYLLNGIGPDRMSKAFLDDLTLLTFGPQLRGGANNKKGRDGITKVFNVIYKIVKSHITTAIPSEIKLVNAPNRTVSIAFASDPDIVIREEMSADSIRNVVAIEVKAGTDISNIHNRVGEAEKSHQKAKNNGYAECWTVINVDNIDTATLKRESPSTNRFYRISDLEAGTGKQYEDFRNNILSLTSI